MGSELVYQNATGSNPESNLQSNASNLQWNASIPESNASNLQSNLLRIYNRFYNRMLRIQNRIYNRMLQIQNQIYFEFTIECFKSTIKFTSNLHSNPEWNLQSNASNPELNASNL